MFGWFGKRKVSALPAQQITRSNWGASAAPAQGPVDDDGIARVFPKELFEGETGDFLRRMGYSPDDPNNIAPTEDTFATLNARAYDKLAHFIRTLNGRLAGRSGLSPLFLIPESVWCGRFRNFLCATCQFYPADPSNVFIRAASPEIAAKTGLPFEPKVPEREIAEQAERMIEIAGKLYESALQEGKPEDIAAREAQIHVRSICMIIATIQFDADIVEDEQAYFGPSPERDYDAFLRSIGNA